MINLIAEFIIVACSSYMLVNKYFYTRLISELILRSFILFFGQIVLVELLLGGMGKFYAGNVFLMHLTILVLTLLACRKEKFVFFKPDLDYFFGSNLLIFAFSVFSAFFLVKIYVNLIGPVICPDSLQVHLAFPAAWIVNGNLDNPINIFGSLPILKPGTLEASASSYYPINAQLFFAWLMLPLRNAFLADLGEAPFYIIGIIAVYVILRKYDVSKKIALLSSFLWVLIPNIFKQLKTGSQIDVICAVLFLLVFYSVLLLKTEFAFRNSILFGICVGLFVGTKVINLVWLAALIPFICYSLYTGARAGKLSKPRVAVFSGAIILMVILFGGFMYIKNYILVGNPLFPVRFKLFGKTIFPGLLDNAAYKMQIAPKDRFNLIRFIFKEGLGAQFLFLILPCTFLPLIFYRYLKTKFYARAEYLLLFATPLIMLFMYRFFVNVYVARYLFPYLSLGLLSAIIFISNFPKGNKYLLTVSFISIFIALFELARGNELVVSILFSLVVFIVLAIYKKQLLVFYKGKTFGNAVLAALFVVVFFLIYLNKDYDNKEFERYPLSFSKREAWQANIGRGWKALNELTKGGSRVAYTGRMEFYPLFGSRLKNTVKYVSINKKEVDLYNKPDGLFRKTQDFPAWEENLRQERIEYLFVALPFSDNRETSELNRFPIEDEWAAAHPDNFRLLFSNSLSHIYKVSIEK